MNEADLRAIQEGMKLAARRKAEYNFAGAGVGERRPNPIQAPLSSYIPTVQPPDPTQAILGPKTLKIWPNIGLASIQAKHTGAWRIWSLAKALDQEGVGIVSRFDLFQYLSSLGVDIRNRQRWLLDAIETRLLIESKSNRVYYLTSTEKAAIALNCNQAGKSASVPTRKLVCPGWRSFIWAAHLTGYNERLVSQTLKCELTGVSDRTQRNYQKLLPESLRKNYSHTRLNKGDIDQSKETTGRHFFKWRDKVYQRLPDIRLVPREVARSLPKGRSRKIQKAINASKQARQSAINNTSSLVGRGTGICIRIFCECAKEIKRSQKRIEKIVGQADQSGVPDDLFRLYSAGNKSNIWVCESPF